jgi:hypothetical protein
VTRTWASTGCEYHDIDRHLCHHCYVRITLDLDDDLLDEVKQYADRRSVALGKAASDLIRRGLNSSLQTKTVNGLQVVVLPENTPKIDSAFAKSLLEGKL